MSRKTPDYGSSTTGFFSLFISLLFIYLLIYFFFFFFPPKGEGVGGLSVCVISFKKVWLNQVPQFYISDVFLIRHCGKGKFSFFNFR